MKFIEKNIKGVFEVQLEQKIDERGFFVRMYDKEVFKRYGLPTDWVQESRAFSKNKGTVRGLHFLYPPNTESKLISMVQGEAFWVFLDIRKKSPTRGKWGSVILSAKKHTLLFLPRGIANGVCTMSDDCHVFYHMDNVYDDSAKGEISWDDPTLGIPWPVKNPTNISMRDRNAGNLNEFLEKTGGGLEV